jgi:hypothetical protein
VGGYLDPTCIPAQNVALSQDQQQHWFFSDFHRVPENISLRKAAQIL